MSKGFSPFMVFCTAAVAGTLVWQDLQRPSTEVSIEVRPFRHALDFMTPLSAMQRYPAVARSRTSPPKSAPPSVTLGFVETQLSYRVQVSRSLTRRRIVSVVAGYTPAVVHVAQEFKQDACSFKHVLDHEQEHVRIFSDGSASWQAGLQELVTQGLNADLPDVMLSIRVEKYILEADKRVRGEHARLDSPAEYRKNLTVCNGRVHKLATGQPLGVVMISPVQ